MKWNRGLGNCGGRRKPCLLQLRARHPNSRPMEAAQAPRLLKNSRSLPQISRRRAPKYRKLQLKWWWRAAKFEQTKLQRSRNSRKRISELTHQSLQTQAKGAGY